MSLRIFWGFFALVAAVALSWGWSIGRQPVPPRPADQTATVSPAWYEALPLDPDAATAAYLERIPADMQERGERFSDTRMIVFALRILDLVIATLLIHLGRLPRQTRDLLGRLSAPGILVDATVALLYFVALYALSLPVEIYATFARQHQFGFSDQPFTSWLADNLIEWAVFTAFYTVGVVAIYRIIRHRPTQWVAWATGIFLVLRATYTFLSPGVIEPMTNSFQPLAESPQKQAILALANANGIDDVAVVTGDASQQTRLLNAHVSGFGGSARISVDDTTLRSTSDPMLRAVVGHEIGHFVMGHQVQSMFTDTALVAIGFALIALAARAAASTRAGRWRVPELGDIASLPLFWGMYLLWGFASLPLSNAISREFERQADLYGLNASQAPHGLAEFMIHDADAVRLRPTAMEYALFYTHPSSAERVKAAMQWRAASERLMHPPR